MGPGWGPSTGPAPTTLRDVASVVLALSVMLGAAKLEGHLAVRAGQPAVLGELIAGVMPGNAVLVGIHWFEAFRADPYIEYRLVRCYFLRSGCSRKNAHIRLEASML